jgi:hypothetical protein
MLDLSSFVNQAVVLTEEEVQALADSANSAQMEPGVHEVVVAAVPVDKISLEVAPNEHLLKFVLKLENASLQSASIYCELPLQPDKMYRINKAGEQDRRNIGRHTKTLLALGLSPGKLSQLIARVVATNGECLQALKGMKATLTIVRNQAKCRLQYDKETGASFVVRNSDDVRLIAEPYTLNRELKGSEKYAEIEVAVRELKPPISLEMMPQTTLTALLEVENDFSTLLNNGKIVNQVKGAVVANATAKLSTTKTCPTPTTNKLPSVNAKPVVKPVVVEPVASIAEQVQAIEEIQDDTGLPDENDLNAEEA